MANNGWMSKWIHEDNGYRVITKHGMETGTRAERREKEREGERGGL